MEKLIDYFKVNHEGKNWTLFLITLGLVHSAWWFNTFDFIKEFGTQNPYFIFLEILFIASSITRILIAIDIFYIIETCPGISDCITLLWKKRRDEWRRWELLDKKLPHLSSAYYNATFHKAWLNYWTHILFYDARLWQYWYIYQNIELTQELHKKFNTMTEHLQEINYITYSRYTVQIPYHIQYWIKLEIKKCRKAIAEEQKFRQRNAKRKLQKSKT